MFISRKEYGKIQDTLDSFARRRMADGIEIIKLSSMVTESDIMIADLEITISSLQDENSRLREKNKELKETASMYIKDLTIGAKTYLPQINKPNRL